MVGSTALHDDAAAPVAMELDLDAERRAFWRVFAIMVPGTLYTEFVADGTKWGSALTRGMVLTLLLVACRDRRH